MPYDLPMDKQHSQSVEVKTEYQQLYKGRYPEGLDLSPNSSMHNYIVDRVMERARRSKTVMANRYDSWREIDHIMTAYVKLDEAERLVRGNDPRKPASLVIPIAYASREVILTYETSAFLDELPYFRYVNQGPEDVVGTALLEKVIEAQNRQMKVALGLYTQLSDGWTYGIGPAHIPWRKKFGRSRKMQDVGFNSFLTGDRTITGQREVAEEELMFEGNAVQSIDPYLYLPDTAVPAHLHQEGEFSAYVEPSTRTKLLSEERHNERMFNVRYVDPRGTRSVLATDQSGRGTRTGMVDLWSRTASSSGGADVVWMWIDLVPSEWVDTAGTRLGPGDYPEKWLFGIAGDTVCIMAGPANLDHNMYPTTCACFAMIYAVSHMNCSLRSRAFAA